MRNITLIIIIINLTLIKLIINTIFHLLVFRRNLLAYTFMMVTIISFKNFYQTTVFFV